MSRIRSTFSVLMSIYHKEKPRYFDSCMCSIWNKQTLKPNEIILVLDGGLTKELYELIDEWKKKLGELMKIIPIEKNAGLGNALNIGLKSCTYDFIARMDTDDIATPRRFEKQTIFLINNSDVDVLGTCISEIDEQGKQLNKVVNYPLKHKDLFLFFKKRDPLAHPTVMFRKRFFEKAGVYPEELQFAEDTLLWYQGFLNGCKFANISYVGLRYRRTSDFYKRRSNIKKTIGLLKIRLLTINTNLNYGIAADLSAIAYFLISLAPQSIKQLLYNKLR